MSVLQEDLVEFESKLAQALERQVEGPVLIGALVRIGGITETLGWLRRNIYGGERGLPSSGSIAVTPSDVYIFCVGDRDEPARELRRWPRATLRATKVNGPPGQLRLFLTLESGKTAIVVFRADSSSQAVSKRVAALFGEEKRRVAAPDGSVSPSEPAIGSQSEEFTRLREGMLAGSYPLLESGEAVRLRLTEMAPAPLVLGPLLLLYGLFLLLFKLVRGSRALLVTDRNLYVVRGRGQDASVLHKEGIGSARVNPGGSILLGRYLELAGERFWMLGPPEPIVEELAAAKAARAVGQGSGRASRG